MNQIYKTPIAQADAMQPKMTKVKNWDEEKYNDMIDFISVNRPQATIGDIQNQLIEDYGPDYEELVRYAISKWAE